MSKAKEILNIYEDIIDEGADHVLVIDNSGSIDRKAVDKAIKKVSGVGKKYQFLGAKIKDILLQAKKDTPGLKQVTIISDFDFMDVNKVDTYLGKNVKINKVKI